MPKEYRTIREVAGPLMMISDVDDVKYDELGEIELPNGETRRCKVLEVDGSNALVQLFDSAAGINLSKLRSLPNNTILLYHTTNENSTKIPVQNGLTLKDSF